MNEGSLWKIGVAQVGENNQDENIHMHPDYFPGPILDTSSPQLVQPLYMYNIYNIYITQYIYIYIYIYLYVRICNICEIGYTCIYKKCKSLFTVSIS